MLKKFKLFIDNEKLCTPNDRILLGVSGGIDSLVMLSLFQEAGYKIGIAHCNFQLRGMNADDDELFVQEIARKYELPFYSTRFNTKEEAEKQGVSIQMIARTLRYEWFQQLCEWYDFQKIAIAHHADDAVETFHINLLRGSGLKGLTGIKTQINNIIRPMLFTGRKHIEAYAKAKKISWREDESNSSTKYIRNKLRHTIIPQLTELNPSYQTNILETIDYLHDAYLIFEKEIEKQRIEIVKEINGTFYLSIEKLKKLNPLKTFLFHFLQPFLFKKADVKDIIFCLDEHSGKTFYSATHKLLKNREELIIVPISQTEDWERLISESEGSLQTTRFSIQWQIVDRQQFTLTPDPEIAAIDAALVSFPIYIRNWREGDSFVPLGMHSKKKISDFFTDNKINNFEKENIPLFFTGKNIFWVAGMRIDNRFKITENTKRVLVFKISEQ